MTVLILNENAQVNAGLAAALARSGLVAEAAPLAEGAARTTQLGPEAIIIEAAFDRPERAALLADLRAMTPCPIMVLAEGADEATRILALDTGADDAMTPPQPWDEVVARLRTRLRRWIQFWGAPADAASSGWRVVLQRRQMLTPSGEVVPLTAAEFDLMAALGAQPGIPVSRTALSLHVLKRHMHDDDRSIDNLVYQVRRKLARYLAEGMLTTVRNQGYASSIPLMRDERPAGG